MYNPAPGRQELEWVELVNQMAVDMDLSGWHLDGGIEFEFPGGTVLSGGGHLVVAADPTALAADGGFSQAMGPYTGRLSNGGETLELISNGQRLMDLVTYGDDAPWPVAPDGSGASLAKIAPEAASESAENWASSVHVGGTPGQAHWTDEDPSTTVALWSVDIEGTAGGAHGVPPDTQSGVEGIYGLGNTWNSFLVTSHPGTMTNPSMPLVDQDGTASPVRFSIEGTVSAWNNASADPLRGDYLFIRAGSAAADISWRIAGLVPGATFEMIVYGNSANGRDFNMAIDTDADGSLADEVARNVSSAGRLFTGITAGTGGLILGNMTNTGHEGNWAGFQLRQVDTNPTGVDVDAAGVVLSEIASATDPEFWLEIHNPTDAAVDLTDYVLRVAGTAVGSYVFPTTTLVAGGYLVLDQETLGFDPHDEDRLFLYDPSQTTVCDAGRVENRLRARSPQHDGRWLNPDYATQGTANHFALYDQIVINEIMYHGYPERDVTDVPFLEAREEWVELFNRSTEEVDLSGWAIGGGIQFDLPEATTLAAGEYLVIARDAATLVEKYPARNAVIVGNFSGRLANGGESLVLLDARGNPADEVRYYDGGRWSKLADGGGSSLELRDPDADNSIAEAWAPSNEADKSEWRLYSYQGIARQDGVGYDIWNEFVVGLLDDGLLLIDDISVIENPDGTPIQLIQNGTFESDTLGSQPGKWRLLGSHGAHGQSYVVEDPSQPGNHVLQLVATSGTEHEHNHAETTLAGNRKIVAGREYKISYRAKWLGGSNQINTRLYFNWLQATTLIDVPNDVGTPGAENSRYEANLGPTYRDFHHGPVVPAPGKSVTVSAIAEDPDGVASMRLYYAVNGAAFVDVAMIDQGDGRYTGTIPGQSGGATGQFYVRGEDTLGAVSTFPAAGPDSRAMFAVEDGRATSGRLHNIRVIMTAADRNLLYLNTNRLSNDRFGATVIYDEQTVIYDAAVRLKGSPWRRNHDSIVSLNVAFPPDNLFRGVHESLVISRGPKKEIVAKHIFNAAGDGLGSSFDDVAYLVAPRSNEDGITTLSMARHTDSYFESQYERGGDGTLYNLELLYTPISTVNGNPEGLKLNFPYSHTNGAVDIRDYGNDKEAYRWNFQIREGRGRDDYGLMIDMAKAMSLSGDELDAASQEVMDVDQWMRTFATASLVGNDDFYTRIWSHNFQMFQRPVDDKMVALPWDLDRAFQLSATASLWGGHNLQKLISLPANRRLYYGHLWDLINTTYNRSYMQRWTSHYTSLTGEGFGGILDYIDSRAKYAWGRLPWEIPFAVTDSRVEGVVAVVEGLGWIDVREIYVRGRADPLDVTWLDQQRWQVTVPVSFGANTFHFEARDHQDRLIGSDEVSLTSTVSSRPLLDYLRITELNYNPVDPTTAERTAGFDDNEDFEYVELQNIGPETLDLAGLAFTDAIQFDFTNAVVTPTVLITEAATGDVDYFEIQNVSDKPVDTTGWVVAVNNAQKRSIDDRDEDLLYHLPGTMAAGEVLYRSDVFGPHYFGDIFWREDEDGWVLVMDEAGNVVDFLVWGYDQSEIESFRVDIEGHEVTAAGVWSGPAVAAEGTETNSLQRTGSWDADNADDWAFTPSTSMGTANAGLAAPFIGEITLSPGEFTVIARDPEAFAFRYGAHVRTSGPYDGKLDNGGEQITLTDRWDRNLLDFRYDDSGDWPGRSDGGGASLQLIDPSALDQLEPGRTEFLEDPGNWRASVRYGGTPGAPRESAVGIVINEVLTHTDLPAVDWIELQNTADVPIDVGGWYLSDSADNYKKYRIPDDGTLATTIPAGAYFVLDETHFNPTLPDPNQISFALSGAHGDDVWLWKADAGGHLTHFADHLEFGAAANGQAIGRWPGASGDPFPMAAPTRGADNIGPRSGSVVIGEVMYAPAGPGGDAQPDDFEFVEIFNTATDPVNLAGWRIRGGIDFDFASETLLDSHAALVIAPFDPNLPNNVDKLTAFRSHYQIDPLVAIVGGYSGQLNDSGERVQLQRPDKPPLDEPDFTPHLLEDEVRFGVATPWPDEPSAGEASLTRLYARLWGHDPTSWDSATPTPGSSDLYVHPGDASLDNVTDVRDFMIWNVHKFTSGTSWTTGDFDNNGVTDVRDFMIWNVNKFTSAPVPAPILALAVDKVFDTDRSLAVELAWISELLDYDQASPQTNERERSGEATDRILAFYW